MFGQLTVATRLALGFGLILSLMIVVSLIGNNRVGFIDRTLTEVGEGASAKQRFAINFRGSVHDRAIAIRDAVLVENNRDLQTHLTEIDRLKAFYRESAGPMDRMMSQPDVEARETRLLDAIKDIQQRTLRLTDELLRNAGVAIFRAPGRFCWKKFLAPTVSGSSASMPLSIIRKAQSLAT